jgi:hypothetical protein
MGYSHRYYSIAVHSSPSRDHLGDQGLDTEILKWIFKDIREEGAVWIKLALGMASTVPL